MSLNVYGLSLRGMRCTEMAFFPNTFGSKSVAPERLGGAAKAAVEGKPILVWAGAGERRSLFAQWQRLLIFFSTKLAQTHQKLAQWKTWLHCARFLNFLEMTMKRSIATQFQPSGLNGESAVSKRRVTVRRPSANGV
jgi:hypothetical protein